MAVTEEEKRLFQELFCRGKGFAIATQSRFKPDPLIVALNCFYLSFFRRTQLPKYHKYQSQSIDLFSPPGELSVFPEGVARAKGRPWRL